MFHWWRGFGVMARPLLVRATAVMPRRPGEADRVLQSLREVEHATHPIVECGRSLHGRRCGGMRRCEPAGCRNLGRVALAVGRAGTSDSSFGEARILVTDLFPRGVGG